MSKTLSDATPNVFQFKNGEKMKHPSASPVPYSSTALELFFELSPPSVSSGSDLVVESGSGGGEDCFWKIFKAPATAKYLNEGYQSVATKDKKAPLQSQGMQRDKNVFYDSHDQKVEI